MRLGILAALVLMAGFASTTAYAQTSDGIFTSLWESEVVWIVIGAAFVGTVYRTTLGMHGKSWSDFDAGLFVRNLFIGTLTAIGGTLASVQGFDFTASPTATLGFLALLVLGVAGVQGGAAKLGVLQPKGKVLPKESATPVKHDTDTPPGDKVTPPG